MAQLRDAYAGGNAEAGARLLAAALEAGLAWDEVSRAVAEGVASDSISSRAATPLCAPDGIKPWRQRLRVAGLVLVGVFGLEAAFVAAALLLRLLSALGPWIAAATPFADPLYTRAAFETLGYAEPIGLALGDRWPLRTALAPGAGALATALAATLANTTLLAVALRIGGVAGRILHIVVAVHLVLSPPTLAEIEASGLSFALGMLMPDLTGRGLGITDPLRSTPGAIQLAILIAVPLLLTYLAAWLLAARLVAPSPGLVRMAGLAAIALAATTCSPPEPQALLVPVVAQQTGISAYSQLVPPDLPEPQSVSPTVQPGPPALPPSAFALVKASRTPKPGPSRVEAASLSQTAYRFEYRVNGRRQVIRGMGYNARHSTLPPEERVRRMDRDFAQMAEAGVNTVQGWDMGLFDRHLLDSAAAHGLGVIMPFQFDPAADYADLKVRARLIQRVEAWVLEHRAHPALRMWALGNEVLHKLVRPTWLGGMHDAPEKVARARAFSDFLLWLADRVWKLDPYHPVTYREAEAGFLVWLREAMLRRGGMPQNLVLGANAYTEALQQIVQGWPDLWMTVPLYVSEFGATGRAPGERSAALRRMWQVIRSRPQWTLGGAVYVWTTDGPEEVDRAFGLVNAGGVPIGNSLATLSELFRSEQAP